MKKLTFLLVFTLCSSFLFSQTLCDSIHMKVDKFTKDTMYIYLVSNNISVSKMKSGKGNPPFYSIMLKTYGKSISVGEKGISVLFDDGEIYQKESEKINVQGWEKGYVYWGGLAFFTEEKLKPFLTKKVTDFKLYIYEQSVKEGDLLKDALNCLLKK